MKSCSIRNNLLALSLSLMAAPLAAAEPAATAASTLQGQLRELELRLDATVSQLEALASRSGAPAATPGGTTIGGYGELHYNNLTNSSGTGKQEVDFHRFVLLIGHRFSDRVRMFSELELEHSLAGEGQPGEVELEQAYVEFDLAPTTRSRAGVFLLPIGILNETHEPPTFYGVERNPVESRIIPTTWWEGGIMLSGEIARGLTYDVAAHSGLDGGYNIRGGRQKVAAASAWAPAYTGRIRWSAVPGLEIAASINHQSDLNQNAAGSSAIRGNLLATHAVYRSGPFGLRALHALWDLQDDGTAAGRQRQTGWYLEPSFHPTPDLGLFARYNLWDNAAGDSTDSRFTQIDVGFNYWPHPDVVVKADYQTQTAPAGQNEYHGINLGIGYQF